VSNQTKYKPITKNHFQTDVIDNKQPTVLVFGLDWSGNSEFMNSMMNRVSKEFKAGILFFKVDLEENDDISSFFGVHSIPTTIMIKDGEVVEFLKGIVPANKIRKKIQAIFLD